jgi:hypothetical protein
MAIVSPPDANAFDWKLAKHPLSGLGAGAIATVALYPLDLVKVRFQINESTPKAYRSVWSALQSIRSQSGVRGLYQGMSPALYGSAFSWGLYFWLYEKAKQRHLLRCGHLGPWEHFMSGMEAGVCCVPLTNPIWLVKVRMQVQNQAASAENTRYRSVSGNTLSYAFAWSDTSQMHSAALSPRRVSSPSTRVPSPHYCSPHTGLSR